MGGSEFEGSLSGSYMNTDLSFKDRLKLPRAFKRA